MLKLIDEHDDILHTASTEWDFSVDGDPTELVKDMVRVLTENGGVGLAAPQVGVDKRIFIMGNFTKMVVCINPMIVSLSEEKATDLEGCLSFPELWLKVKRPISCTVQYQSTLGEVVERDLDGLEARVFLHEFDHLIGVTFDQRVGEVSLNLAQNKRKKELKKKKKSKASA
jgi:peptide deformylase